MAAGQPLHVFVCWGKTSPLNNWGLITTVPDCSSGTLTNVLPHRNALPQTQDMTPHPVTVYRHRADLSLCYPLMFVVFTTFLSWKFSTMRVLCGYASSPWKMKPESTAAIPKRITTGYHQMVTHMHTQTWCPPPTHTAIELISVIFFAHPYLFKLICRYDIDLVRNNFCVFL